MSRTDDQISRYRLDRVKKLPSTVSRRFLHAAQITGTLTLTRGVEIVLGRCEADIQRLAIMGFYLFIRLLGMGIQFQYLDYLISREFDALNYIRGHKVAPTGRLMGFEY